MEENRQHHHNQNQFQHGQFRQASQRDQYDRLLLLYQRKWDYPQILFSHKLSVARLLALVRFSLHKLQFYRYWPAFYLEMLV